MNFSIDRNAQATVLRIEGELDALSAPELRPSIEAIVNEAPKLVVVDLGALRMIDSSGVGAIVSLFKRVRASGGKVTVKGLAGQPLAIFQILRLDRVFETTAG
ncbi:MAG: STAS domain-containing protein [Deltaproteobacteria bacterium]|nr:STAS domain-containing protein [Deltaproteobacteria bacterium]